jgi:metal-dependent amidase/aminoacylase/carboxypeptidase family protein
MNIVELKKKVCDRIDQRRDEMIRVAQRMLKRPELGYREVKAAALVKEELQKLNLTIREGLALTGVEARSREKRQAPRWW